MTISVTITTITTSMKETTAMPTITPNSRPEASKLKFQSILHRWSNWYDRYMAIAVPLLRRKTPCKQSCMGVQIAKTVCFKHQSDMWL